MDEPTLTRVMTAMATTLGTALSNQANTERAAQAASTARLVSAIRSSNTSDRKPKVDTTNQILKAERDAHDFTKDEAFDPDKHSVTLYRTEIKEKLQNKFCKDVIDYAGIEMYRRQSNALHQRIVEFERGIARRIRARRRSASSRTELAELHLSSTSFWNFSLSR